MPSSVLIVSPVKVVRLASGPVRVTRATEQRAVRVLSVAQQGRTGAQGERGLPGSVAATLPFSSITGATYTHTQSVASALWQIPHNLGRPLTWTIADSAGTVIVPGQRLIDLNTQHLTFGAPMSGVAYGS